MVKQEFNKQTPKTLDERAPETQGVPSITPNSIYLGDNRKLLPLIEKESIALSVWSPPYFVGKSYEKDMTFEEWKDLLREVIALHFPIIKPGGFVAINIGDILAFPDERIPKYQGNLVSRKKRPDVTREKILEVKKRHPDWNKYRLAEYFGCSEQTIERRLKGVNIRGGKYEPQTKVKIVGGLIEEWAESAGFYIYDRRVWVKDPAWANSRWHTSTYKSVDEFEYIYILWKPGETVINRNRLSPEEWSSWGSRGVWTIRSVRANDDHEAKFPIELPLRLIRLLSEPGEIVLDPFLGSGTTAVAAIRAGRQYIGIEILPEYYELAKRNIDAELAKVKSEEVVQRLL